MPFGPWNKNPQPCRQCMSIYDDERGRLKNQMIPCLQAQKAAALGQTAFIAVHIDNIGFPCPFACTVGDLVPYARNYRSAVTNQKAREILEQINQWGAGLLKQGVTGLPPQKAVSEGDFDMHDPRPYLTAPGTRMKKGRFVVLKGEKGSALWNEFKPWYMTNVSSSLNGWSMPDKFCRMLDLAAAQTPGEVKNFFAALREPANAAKFAGFLLFLAALQTNAAGRVLAYLIGASLTAEMIAQLTILLLNCGKCFLEADTEAGLSEAGNWLAKFFAQVIIFLGMVAAAAVIGALIRGVLKNSRATLEEASTKPQPTAQAAAETPAAARAPNLPPWRTRITAEAQRIADGISGGPHCDLPANIGNWNPEKIRAWLRANGYTRIKEATKIKRNDGTFDWMSEIWYRERPEMRAAGKVEAVRLDPHGHNVPSDFAGAKPHLHADAVPYSESQTYLNMYVPELPAPYRPGGVPVPKYEKPGDFNASLPEQKPTNPTYFPDTHVRVKPGPKPGQSRGFKQPKQAKSPELDPGMRYPAKNRRPNIRKPKP